MPKRALDCGMENANMYELETLEKMPDGSPRWLALGSDQFATREEADRERRGVIAFCGYAESEIRVTEVSK